MPGHQLSLWVTSSKLPNHFPKWLCHCTFPQQGTRVLIFLHPLQHLLSSTFLRITTLEGARRHPTVGLICTPQRLMALSIFSMCLLVVCISFLEKRLFKSFAPFLIGLFVLSLLHYKYSSSLQDTGPLSDCKHFLLWFRLSFHFPNGMHTIVLNADEDSFFFILRVGGACAFGVPSKEPRPNPKSQRFYSVSFQESYSFSSCVYLRSKIHFLLIFTFTLWKVKVC